MKASLESHMTLAKQVIAIEAESIQNLATMLDEDFDRACELCLNCKGRIIVCGIGKSGHIGKKIASTLASTGTPAFFVHPGEAIHGDLGMITPRDVVLAISQSGSSPEILTLIPFLQSLNTPYIAMTGRAHSLLAENAHSVIHTNVAKEACPLGLAPTSSTTAALVMGDALAIALLKAKGFTKNDFARSHPGGSLGKRLLLTAQDIMHKADAIPLATEATRLNKALIEMTKKRMGCINIINESGEMIGIFTDGDLRRMLDQGIDIHTTRIGQVMTRNSVVSGPTTLASDLLRIMSKQQIMVITITDLNHHPIGIVHMHDLIQAGVH